MSKLRDRARRWMKPAALGAVLALFLGLLAWFAPPSLLFSKQPVVSYDYALHAYQVERALNAFRSSGALWAYDPLVLAGQPAGVVEDLTNKGTELFVIGLAALGLHPAFAFNLFILLAHLAMPAACWASARLFGLSKVEASVALLLWVLMWFFDSFMHWCWAIGMITWSATCYLTVLYIGVLQRTLETRALRWFLWLALLGATLTLIHPFGALTLIVPGLALYARAFRTLRPLEHLLLLFAVLAAASTVLIWIGPLLRFRHYVGDVDTFFRPTAEYALFDAVDLLKDWHNTGVPVRTMIRMLCFVAGGICLWRWRKAGDSRALPLAALVLWAVLLSYVSGYFWHARQTQPYRHIGPAMLAAALPAAVLLTDVLSPSSLRELTPRTRVLVLLMGVLILPRFFRTAIHYFPGALPERVFRSKLDLMSSSLVGLHPEPLPFEMRLVGAPKEYQAVQRWLLDNHRGRGRVFVADWVLSEYLAGSTSIPMVGGIVERNVPHVDAHLFRMNITPELPSEVIRSYFERYAVGYVILYDDLVPLDYRRDLLEPVQVIERYRIYRSRIEPSYFLRGSGQVTYQGLNRIQIAEAAGSDVVLRFHFMETLRCRPGCGVERFEMAGDRVGFIRVPNPPPSFEIYNSY